METKFYEAVVELLAKFTDEISQSYESTREDQNQRNKNNNHPGTRKWKRV